MASDPCTKLLETWTVHAHANTPTHSLWQDSVRAIHAAVPKHDQQQRPITTAGMLGWGIGEGPVCLAPGRGQGRLCRQAGSNRSRMLLAFLPWHPHHPPARPTQHTVVDWPARCPPAGSGLPGSRRRPATAARCHGACGVHEGAWGHPRRAAGGRARGQPAPTLRCHSPGQGPWCSIAGAARGRQATPSRCGGAGWWWTLPLRSAPPSTACAALRLSLGRSTGGLCRLHGLVVVRGVRAGGSGSLRAPPSLTAVCNRSSTIGLLEGTAQRALAVCQAGAYLHWCVPAGERARAELAPLLSLQRSPAAAAGGSCCGQLPACASEKTLAVVAKRPQVCQARLPKGGHRGGGISDVRRRELLPPAALARRRRALIAAGEAGGR